MAERLPPIHDVVRFWYPKETAVFGACKSFISRDPPSWNLHWLREWAPRIFSGELTDNMLRQAVNAHVPLDSRPSVIRAIELIFRSIEKHKWNGRPLIAKTIRCGVGRTTLMPVGIYHSDLLGSNLIVALQPRAESVPNLEQYRIWHSSLFYEYSEEKATDAVIIDLSKNTINGNRELSELDSRKLPFLEKHSISDRLDQVALQFFKALDDSPKIKGPLSGSSKQGKLKL